MKMLTTPISEETAEDLHIGDIDKTYKRYVERHTALCAKSALYKIREGTFGR